MRTIIITVLSNISAIWLFEKQYNIDVMNCWRNSSRNVGIYSPKVYYFARLQKLENIYHI
jgi:hypothetical protein